MVSGRIEAAPAPALRPPHTVMRLARMGAAFATRLSFKRVLLRRLARENWRFDCPVWDLDHEGFGTAVLSVEGPERRYALVVFTADLPADQRTDRVIAEAWDATFTLHDGIPDQAEIARLAGETPRQEAGRFGPRDLVLGRANRSMRLFESVVAALAAGRQPELEALTRVGYLMRTTAVYGSGKFGCADRDRLEERPELRGSFQVEMLAVYLFRWFTILLIEHLARCRGGSAAVALSPARARHLGIGNATGLGMAPFLVRHPALLDRWARLRETALARVRALPEADPASRDRFLTLLARARRHVACWQVDDAVQQERIDGLRDDLADLADLDLADLLARPFPWDGLHRLAEARYGLEAQELLLSLLLEPQGARIDDLAEAQWARERDDLDPAMTVGELREGLRAHYSWALEPEGEPDAEADRRFWYYSEEKLEPRLGWRGREPGADLAMPLGNADNARRLHAALERTGGKETAGQVSLRHPELRHALRRLQAVMRQPYAEVHDDLESAAMRPIDLLRFKLAQFGATGFDPRSDLWTRITLFQGAPQPGELDPESADDWAFPVPPEEGS